VAGATLSVQPDISASRKEIGGTTTPFL